MNREGSDVSKFNSFKLFCKLCDVIAKVSKYTDKSCAVDMFVRKGYFLRSFCNFYTLSILFFRLAIHSCLRSFSFCEAFWFQSYCPHFCFLCTKLPYNFRRIWRWCIFASKTSYTGMRSASLQFERKTVDKTFFSCNSHVIVIGFLVSCERKLREFVFNCELYFLGLKNSLALLLECRRGDRRSESNRWCICDDTQVFWKRK